MECGEYNNIRQDNLSQHFKIMVNISYETGTLTNIKIRHAMCWPSCYKTAFKFHSFWELKYNIQHLVMAILAEDFPQVHVEQKTSYWVLLLWLNITQEQV